MVPGPREKTDACRGGVRLTPARPRSPHPAFPTGRPVKVGRRFLLVPGETPGKKPPSEGKDRISIHLSRGRAFGSGLHETTINCIEALEGIPSLEDRSVLDVGTGTGILSLAALSLGARNAVAFDIDSDAARTCRRNAVINRMSERLAVFQGTLDSLNPSIRFDLVLANIYGDIILKEAQRLAGHTREKGCLVMSGLDYTDNRAVKLAMEGYGMEVVSVLFHEDYVTQVWRRPSETARKEP